MSYVIRGAVLLLLAYGTSAVVGEEGTRPLFPDGWSTRSPRDEIRPEFAYVAEGGPSRSGSLVIEHDAREGLDGWFEKTYPVHGGEYVRLWALRRLENVVVPRRSALVRIKWQNVAGEMVSADVSDEQVAKLGHVPSAEPEHPVDRATHADGWTEVGGFYRVPTDATQAVVELHLQWAPGGRVEWTDVALITTDKPQPRKVRLAAVHYRPTGKSAVENCCEYAPLIADAARQHADLVVLGETVPAVGLRASPHELAEPIPGPTTEYFAGLAKEHQLYIVLSLHERETHLVYNTAVLLAPDGGLVGKYRKVSLPHAEVESGVAPGNAYPVFETKFGRIGLMVCYDGFFPEVARALTNNGAEVIAWPVWGCNPLLAKARACENHVYVVSSTYMQPSDNWMVSAVFGPSGDPLVQASQWGSVAVAEVDLNETCIGPYNLGDFRSMVQRHRPVAPTADGR